MADGRTLLLVLSTEGNPTAAEHRPAGLYRLRVRRDGSAGAPQLFWASRFGDVPDGFAIASATPLL